METKETKIATKFLSFVFLSFVGLVGVVIIVLIFGVWTIITSGLFESEIEGKSFSEEIICENVPTFNEEGVWNVIYLANGTCVFEKEETEIIILNKRSKN